jgi:TatD DNase family protein
MKYFDAHTHLNFAAYKGEEGAAVTRALDAGVGVNIVGTQYDTSVGAVQLAERHEGAYATIGLHPIHTGKSFHDAKELGEGNKEFTSRGEVFDIEKYVALGQNPKVIAVGECGLDYYRLEEKTKEMQAKAFIEQIELANRLNKPLMLHIRDGQHGGGESAYLDALELLKAHAKVKGDVHFFAGTLDVAKKFIEFGFTLSFTGVVTFTRDYDEVVRYAPSDMLLTETDAPYITPAPHRGKRNESAYIPLIVEAIARIRGEDVEEMRGVLFENARRVFGIKG